MSSNKLVSWENIGHYTTRAKVPGGWVLRVQEDIVLPSSNEGLLSTGTYSSALTFIADPEHRWGKEEALEELIKGKQS